MKPLSFSSYYLFSNQIRPGDVIVFSGIDLPSTVVKLATSSEYVHVAIVLSTTSDHLLEDPILIAESHIDVSLPSLGSGKKILGVQIQQLSQRLATVHGPVWWAALKVDLEPTKLQQMQDWLREIEKQQIPYDFPQAIVAGIPSKEQIGLEIAADFSALFCSELVTRALQIAGVLNEQINPSAQTPTDVIQFSCFKPLVLIQNRNN